MFYKSSNKLKFRDILKKRIYQNNLETQFGLQGIPKDNQILMIIRLSQLIYIKLFFKTTLSGIFYMIVIDAVEYHLSHTIKCLACLLISPY